MDPNLGELPSSSASVTKQYEWMLSIAANIASSSKVRDVKVSPDGKHVLYQVQRFYEDATPAGGAEGDTSSSTPVSGSELWLAKVEGKVVARNARRLFGGGAFNDRSGRWLPDSRRIIFISDRLDGGGSGRLCIADVVKAEGGGEGTEKVESTMSTPLKYGISLLALDTFGGRFVAFTTQVDVAKAQDIISTISDAKIYGERATASRLGVLDIQTGECIVSPSALGPMNPKEHIESLCWAPDGREVLYRVRQRASWEFTEQDVELRRIQVVDDDGRLKEEFGPGSLVETFSRSPPSKHLWLPSGHVATLQSFIPENVLDSQTLFLSNANGQGRPQDSTRVYGETEDALRMVDSSFEDAQGKRHSLIAVEVANGVNTHINVVEVDAHNSPRTICTIYTTNDNAVWSGAWDVRTTVGDDGSPCFTLAAVLTSGPRHEPPDVWVFRASLTSLVEGNRPGGIPISISHLPWLGELPAIRTETVQWEASDGTVLNGLVRYPPGYRKEDGAKPTVLHIHGGPYSRDIPDYTVYFCNWREYLAWAGYVVISPNFRGGQGHGHEFASAANKGIGVHDWPDCESMVDHFVANGIADPSRLGVAGWSHGGSLTAWGVSLTKNKFKAAVVGAGATNWEAMVAESVPPELEAAVGRRNPWDHTSVRTAKFSPIHHVANIETAVLLLHGEEDSGVPLGQAVGFFRGLKRKAAQRGQELARLVVYPREPHGFEEREHAQDVLMRVFHYFQKHL